MGRGLQDEFPNPERAGCPGREIVAAIAAHRMPLSEAESYLDHLTSCSPCYRDFLQLRGEYRQRRTQVIFAVAASVLIVIGLTTWIMRHQHSGTQMAAVIDLRDRAVTRGTEPPPSEPPLKIAHGVSHLDIYLPLGSSEGPYDIRIEAAKSQILHSGAGIAQIMDGVTVLRIDMNLASAVPGLYVLEIRKAGSEWSSYPMRIQ